ncbi:hypothetical protein J3R30DRAFT_1686976 [Lentinula aciculospora]|uniref:Tyrosine specific protein phosphatases domain-containing protein n=1 Tax=Lentinula aciculospora TaxID=153920 RepID=A0A9W8ZVR1_9AGAR|nr:hypothetical protein J3R30DRAFT_1686976 [Lentinula aciculospora]
MLIHDSQSLAKPHEHIDFAKETEDLATPCTLSSPAPSTAEDTAKSRIAQLASQHNFSEYSCLKYGPNGHPGLYVPLSVQAPQTFQELRARQVEWTNAKSWWYSEKVTETTSTIVLGPSGASEVASDSLSDGLAQQLSAAIDEQFPKTVLEGKLNRSNSNGAQGHAIKTSSSHPINISAIIPVEILALLSSHLMFTHNGASIKPPGPSPSLDPQPTIFEIPSPFTLDRFILSHTGHLQTHFSPSLQNSIPPPPISTDTILDPHYRTRSRVTEALQAALNSGIKTPVEEPHAAFHSNGSSVSLSISIKAASREMTRTTPDNEHSNTEFGATVDIPSEATSETGPPTNEELQAEAQLPSVASIPSSTCSTAAPTFLLGNLFMSSCPGKKVRLQGPVKGRSGVCRDLSADLRRMKDLGVRCVVWYVYPNLLLVLGIHLSNSASCLDDTELEFLGAPWPEYQAATNKLGLDVLRLPTPEGLAPALSPALLDKELATLIQSYTLRGIPVLVHCRGGVGRAGVISACWILKLGLCGWLNDASSSVISMSKSSSSATDGANMPLLQSLLKQDTLELVEKVIAVVRRRRSVKAVETYEQVQFLVDFIEHLRTLQHRKSTINLTNTLS